MSIRCNESGRDETESEGDGSDSMAFLDLEQWRRDTSTAFVFLAVETVNRIICLVLY